MEGAVLVAENRLVGNMAHSVIIAPKGRADVSQWKRRRVLHTARAHDVLQQDRVRVLWVDPA
jgi:hypothetical protein